MERYLSPAKVGEFFGVTTDAIRRLARTGQVPSVKIGRQVRIPAAFIEGKEAAVTAKMKQAEEAQEQKEE